jgi:hypothetical protein
MYVFVINFYILGDRKFEIAEMCRKLISFDEM